MSHVERRCGNCAHGTFPRTPTGRIRRNVDSKCSVTLDLWLSIVRRIEGIPCIGRPRSAQTLVSPLSPAGSCPRWQKAPRQSAAPRKERLKRCAASRDGDCSHDQCPQNRDGEPAKSGRHCPLDTGVDP